VLEHQLFSTGIPYRVYGGLRFFERQEIKHALAYLRLIANADDDTAFARVVNFPTRGIGARSLELLSDSARTYNTSLYATVPHLAGRPAASLAVFVRLIEDMRQATRDLPLPEVIDHVLEHSGLRAHYRAEREGEERLANLDELLNAGANFISEAEDPTLTGFLAHASLEAGEHQADAGQEAIQLMTVHAAKGLEFDAVFLTGVEEGLFPHENSIQETDGLEEERRLMYVAVTRARKRLYLTLAQSRMLHGQTRYSLKSRFIDEIPPQLIKWLTPRQSAPRYYEPSQESAHRTPPRSAAAPSRDLAGFRIGQLVRHAKFGEGVIVSAEGSGGDAKVQINFGGAHGIKWLMLAMAKLEAA